MGTQVRHCPPPLLNGASRTVHHPTGRGGGCSGGLTGHGDRTGQEASRAAPVPGPTAEQGARAATADLGTREATAGPPPRPWPQPPPRSLRLEPHYLPKKIPWGK